MTGTLSGDEPLARLIAAKPGISTHTIMNVTILIETPRGVLVSSTIGTGAELKQCLLDLTDNMDDQIPWETN